MTTGKLPRIRSAILGRLITLVFPLVVASVAFAAPVRSQAEVQLTKVDGKTTATVVAKNTCPANYERGSAACKKARADGSCPERQGGKCLAKKQ